MKVPNGFTEPEVVQILDKIAKKLAYKFIFPPYTAEDIMQEARIIGIEGLNKYSDKYPLENFLWVHIRRRLCTFKRDHYMRQNKPCLNCPLKAYIKLGDICKKYQDKKECEWYSDWLHTTEKKKNLIAPISMGYEHYEEKDILDNISNKEIINLIDDKIPLEVRELWLRLKGGVKLSNAQMNEIKTAVAHILQTNEINTEDWDGA